MWAFLLFVISMADEASHRYIDGDRVVLWLSKLGPLGNPQETYPFSRIPFCYGSDEPLEKDMRLAEAIAEHEIIDSRYPIRFRE